MSQEKPQDFHELFLAYIRSLKISLGEERGQKEASNLQTVLTKWIFPSFGLPEEVAGAKALEWKKFDICIVNHLEAVLQDALRTAQGKLSDRTRESYVRAIKKLLVWTVSQKWWAEITEPPTLDRASRRTVRRKTAKDGKIIAPTKRKKWKYTGHDSYILKEELISDPLAKELEQFNHFLTTFTGATNNDFSVQKIDDFLSDDDDEPLVSPRHKKKRNKSARTYRDNALRALGWLYSEHSIHPEMLSLSILAKTRTIKSYLNWLEGERELVPQSISSVLKALLNVSKFVYHEKSKTSDYSDIPVIIFIRNKQADLREAIKNQPPTSDFSKKWLERDEVIAVVRKERNEALAKFTSTGQKRLESQTARLFQRYLIAALMTFFAPERIGAYAALRIVDKLERKSSLQKSCIYKGTNPNGKECWIIDWKAAELKTGEIYGDKEPIYINDDIYPHLNEDIDLWVYHYRPLLVKYFQEEQQHDFLFVRTYGSKYIGTEKSRNSKGLCGLSATRNSLSRLVEGLFAERSGKLTNPQFLRHIWVTWTFEDDGLTAKEIRGIRWAMGHSEETASAHYKRIQPQLEMIAAQRKIRLRGYSKGFEE